MAEAVAVGFFADTHTAEHFFGGIFGTLALTFCRSWLHHYLEALSLLDWVLLRLTLETCLLSNVYAWLVEG